MMTPSANTITVDLEPVGRRAERPVGGTILEAAQAAGVELQSICGGMGLCSGCRVRVIHGELEPLNQSEQAQLSEAEIASGFRLACQAALLSDARVEIPPESLATPQRLQIEGQATAVPVDPIVAPIDVRVAPPGPTDLRSDVTRLQGALSDESRSFECDVSVLAGLSEQLRRQDWSARLAVRRPLRAEAPRQLVAVLPERSQLWGLAVDIGTTKVAAYLVDLETGEVAAKTGAMNPQIACGEDVVSRIAYANQRQADGRAILQDRIVETLNALAEELCAQVSAAPDCIVEAVAVGNTAMHHLFLGLPVRQLGESPYVPAVSQALEVSARALGLRFAPGARVYLPPNIAGYVGADHVAMLLAADLGSTQRTVLALDIGTNTEISLAHDGRLICCSCASGPAFEGAHIQDGMRAGPGAIERVRLLDGEPHLHTIANVPPIGICGSGVLDVVAELLKAGVLDRRGRMRAADARVRAGRAGSEWLVAPGAATSHGRDIVVTRGDVNEIQLAKAAIRAGIDSLLTELDLAYHALEEVIIAGAFGTYLDVASAVRIGLFPDIPVERFRQVGNAAGIGARQLLVSRQRRQAADAIARRMEYVELTVHPAFRERFTSALLL